MNLINFKWWYFCEKKIKDRVRESCLWFVNCDGGPVWWWALWGSIYGWKACVCFSKAKQARRKERRSILECETERVKASRLSEREREREREISGWVEKVSREETCPTWTQQFLVLASSCFARSQRCLLSTLSLSLSCLFCLILFVSPLITFSKHLYFSFFFF